MAPAEKCAAHEDLARAIREGFRDTREDLAVIKNDMAAGNTRFALHDLAISELREAEAKRRAAEAAATQASLAAANTAIESRKKWILGVTERSVAAILVGIVLGVGSCLFTLYQLRPH